VNGHVTFDDGGVRRVTPDGRVEEVQWDELLEVGIVTTAEGPFDEDVFWLLVGADGNNGVAVPGSAMTDDLLDRVQALPGFDNEQMIRAMSSTDEAQFRCWQRDSG
jgi:hypothetical protein